MSNFTVARFSASECDALYAFAHVRPPHTGVDPSMVTRQRTFMAPLSFENRQRKDLVLLDPQRRADEVEPGDDEPRVDVGDDLAGLGVLLAGRRPRALHLPADRIGGEQDGAGTGSRRAASGPAARADAAPAGGCRCERRSWWSRRLPSDDFHRGVRVDGLNLRGPPRLLCDRDDGAVRDLACVLGRVGERG
jgi:hypothetical protein